MRIQGTKVLFSCFSNIFTVCCLAQNFVKPKNNLKKVRVEVVASDLSKSKSNLPADCGDQMMITFLDYTIVT